jgi:hypothetical protein
MEDVHNGYFLRTSLESEKYSTGPDGKSYWRDTGEDFFWVPIYEFERHMDVIEPDGSLVNPYEGGAYRWEIVDVKNHIIINNGVDLPIVYKNTWEQAEPLYGLRENGVISVGTISSYQDRLFCGDLTVLIKGYDKWFRDAEDPYGYFFNDPLYGPDIVAERYQYRMVYSSEGDPKLFNSGTIDSQAVVMESGGIPGNLVISNGRYSFNPDYNCQIGTNGSMYKLYEDGLYRSDEAYTVNMVSPISTIYLDDQYNTELSSIFLDKDSTGYKLVRYNGSNVGLSEPGTADLLPNGTYRIVLRPYVEQLRNPAAFREFPQDGSRILRMESLADKLVVYRDSGFFFLSRTNNQNMPFAVEPRYTGGRVADFRHTIINIDGKQHIFMGNSGIYAINRSSTEPMKIGMFEIGPPFWTRVPPELSEFVYAVDNPITREVFIVCPLTIEDDKLVWGCIAYDYINNTLSEIDVSFTACSFIRRPKHNRIGPEEPWFVMGVHQASSGEQAYIGTQVRDDAEYGGVLVRYGYGPPKVNEVYPYRIYHRLGKGYESKIKSGLIDFGDSFSDKEIRSYVLELSSKYGTTPVRVKISTSTAPQGTEEIETMQVIDGEEVDYVELNNLVDENMIPMFVRAPYIRDEIIVLPEYDSDNNIVNNPIKIVGRTFEVSGVNTRSTTQAYNQG